MQLDRDGIISILIGLVLILVVFLWKYLETQNVVAATIGLIVELVRGGLTGIGILFFVVGLLFIFG